MARKVIDPCMFCGELPCVCFVKPKKEKASKKVDDKTRMQERAKARKRTAVEKPATPVVKAPPVQHERVEVDETRVAITVLAEAGMLHATEKENHPYAFPKLTLEERLRIWKEKVNAA